MPWNNRNNPTPWCELVLMLAIVVLTAAVPVSLIVTAATANRCEAP